jgi:carbonic anhydrase/acetyltransferase-like protein (isoleucine patch superfamily)
VIVKVGDKQPSIHETAYVSEMAFLSGDVRVDAGASVFPFVSARGDLNYIHIGEGSNVQDGSVLHVTDEYPVEIGKNVTVGHGAILHGCTVKDGALIGMGAIVLDGAIVEEGAIVAAGALVPPGKVVPAGALAIGSPFKVVRDLSDEEKEAILKNAEEYQRLRDIYKEAEKGE